MVMSDGTILCTGDTVVQISEGEATTSDNWQPVGITPPPPPPPPSGDSNAGSDDDDASGGE